ncbi:unnamed protein product [Vitrella brassicaformis CCMP3155]|uniref:RRM domain-containing protein n=1 Tax=Vitrella brassicaformis (strain CCMP3155) TaxID=1169540 RepID=A0A0G4F036_VITBC|nr:unnamed protein product [Vitrella brassicaformis CCMP3155]|eukprot:CEM05252.1 unnamed protein product [Vitrella brassicaformis CCMP3155]
MSIQQLTEYENSKLLSHQQGDSHSSSDSVSTLFSNTQLMSCDADGDKFEECEGNDQPAAGAEWHEVVSPNEGEAYQPSAGPQLHGGADHSTVIVSHVLLSLGSLQAHSTKGNDVLCRELASSLPDSIQDMLKDSSGSVQIGSFLRKYPMLFRLHTNDSSEELVQLNLNQLQQQQITHTEPPNRDDTDAEAAPRQLQQQQQLDGAAGTDRAPEGVGEDAPLQLRPEDRAGDVLEERVVNERPPTAFDSHQNERWPPPGVSHPSPAGSRVAQPPQPPSQRHHETVYANDVPLLSPCSSIGTPIPQGLSTPPVLPPRGAMSGPPHDYRQRSRRDRHRSSRATLRLRGLPYSAKPEQIREFFREYDEHILRNNGVQIVYNADGKSTGNAFVHFTDPAAAAQALEEKNMAMFATRYVEIFACGGGRRKAAAADRDDGADHLMPSAPAHVFDSPGHSSVTSYEYTAGGGPPVVDSQQLAEIDPCLDGEGLRSLGSPMVDGLVNGVQMAAQSPQPSRKPRIDTSGMTTGHLLMEVARNVVRSPDRQTPLSILGMSLTPKARIFLKQHHTRLKEFLHQHPNLFHIGGNRGSEIVAFCATSLNDIDLSNVPPLPSPLTKPPPLQHSASFQSDSLDDDLPATSSPQPADQDAAVVSPAHEQRMHTIHENAVATHGYQRLPSFGSDGLPTRGGPPAPLDELLKATTQQETGQHQYQQHQADELLNAAPAFAAAADAVNEAPTEPPPLDQSVALPLRSDPSLERAITPPESPLKREFAASHHWGAVTSTMFPDAYSAAQDAQIGAEGRQVGRDAVPPSQLPQAGDSRSSSMDKDIARLPHSLNWDEEDHFPTITTAANFIGADQHTGPPVAPSHSSGPTSTTSPWDHPPASASSHPPLAVSAVPPPLFSGPLGNMWSGGLATTRDVGLALEAEVRGGWQRPAEPAISGQQHPQQGLVSPTHPANVLADTELRPPELGEGSPHSSWLIVPDASREQPLAPSDDAKASPAIKVSQAPPSPADDGPQRPPPFHAAYPASAAERPLFVHTPPTSPPFNPHLRPAVGHVDRHKKAPEWSPMPSPTLGNLASPKAQQEDAAGKVKRPPDYGEVTNDGQPRSPAAFRERGTTGVSVLDVGMMGCSLAHTVLRGRGHGQPIGPSVYDDVSVITPSARLWKDVPPSLPGGPQGAKAFPPVYEAPSSPASTTLLHKQPPSDPSPHAASLRSSPTAVLPAPPQLATGHLQLADRPSSHCITAVTNPAPPAAAERESHTAVEARPPPYGVPPGILSAGHSMVERVVERGQPSGWTPLSGRSSFADNVPTGGGGNNGAFSLYGEGSIDGGTARSIHSDGTGSSVLGDPTVNRSSVLRLRGIPFGASAEDVRRFFDEHALNILPDGVRLLFNPDGRPSGKAIVKMRGHEEAVGAQQSLHCKTMGSRYIEVFLAPPRMWSSRNGDSSNSSLVNFPLPPRPDTATTDRSVDDRLGAGRNAHIKGDAVLPYASQQRPQEHDGLVQGGYGVPPPPPAPFRPGEAQRGGAGYSLQLQQQSLVVGSQQQQQQQPHRPYVAGAALDRPTPSGFTQQQQQRPAPPLRSAAAAVRHDPYWEEAISLRPRSKHGDPVWDEYLDSSGTADRDGNGRLYQPGAVDRRDHSQRSSFVPGTSEAHAAVYRMLRQAAKRDDEYRPPQQTTQPAPPHDRRRQYNDLDVPSFSQQQHQGGGGGRPPPPPGFGAPVTPGTTTSSVNRPPPPPPVEPPPRHQSAYPAFVQDRAYPPLSGHQGPIIWGQPYRPMGTYDGEHDRAPAASDDHWSGGGGGGGYVTSSGAAAKHSAVQRQVGYHGVSGAAPSARGGGDGVAGERPPVQSSWGTTQTADGNPFLSRAGGVPARAAGSYREPALGAAAQPPTAVASGRQYGFAAQHQPLQQQQHQQHHHPPVGGGAAGGALEQQRFTEEQVLWELVDALRPGDPQHPFDVRAVDDLFGKLSKPALTYLLRAKVTLQAFLEKHSEFFGLSWRHDLSDYVVLLKKAC